ncbi:hypothetical protein [Pedobacter sp. WC2423]|uniref:hypothetical protein n=1 Tax=Pedobacter sp. WC2423 TaxID=3234142 RepID=UPI0034660919
MKYILMIFLFIMASDVFAQVSPAVVKQLRDEAKVKGKETPFISDVTGNTLSQNQIFKEVDPLGFDLFNANLSFSEKDQVQKIGFSPLKLISNWYTDWGISNLRISAANSSTGLTSGLSLGYDGSALESARVRGLYTKLKAKLDDDKLLPVLRPRGAAESTADYTIYYQSVYRKKLDELIEEFDLARLKHVFKVQGGYNAQFFSVLGSNSPTSTFDSLNYHGFKGNNLFLTASYSFNNGWLNLSAGYNYFNKRKAADSTQILNRYDGFSFGVSKRVVQLIGTEALKKKDFYKNTRFIPSILFGVSYERSKFLGQDYLFAEEGAKHIYTWTPYIEFAIIPTVQFRMGFPFKNSELFDTKSKGQTINTVFQFNYKLINLN